VKVQILGTGCPKCKKLLANTEKAVEESGVENAQIEKVDQLQDIMEFGVMMTPALAIDGEVKASGRVLSVEEIQTILEGE